MFEAVLSRKVLFCGGKGGVGKTTVSAALGVIAAAAGRRALLVSTDPAHSLGDVLDKKLGDRPRAIRPGLSALELDPEKAADEYLAEVGQRLREYVKPALYDEVERQMAQARQSPGAVEAAVMERVAALVAEPPEGLDMVIFDTAPTGQTLHLLNLPEAMAAWTEGLLARHRESQFLAQALGGWFAGRESTAAERRRARLAAALERRRRRFRQAREVLTDAERTAFVLVLIPERLPVEETVRAAAALTAAGIPVAGLVVNQVLPAHGTDAFLAARRQVQERYLGEIRRRLSGWPCLELPLLAGEVSESRGLDELADQLRMGLESRG